MSILRNKPPVSADALTAAHSPVLDGFVSPKQAHLPMARMWFPDAEAGNIEHDQIARIFNDISKGGMGGVEVALLSDENGNMDGTIGWGTPAWVRTLKKVMKAAKAIPGGFRVDFTITAHWPPILNTIDPNDDCASTNMVYAVKKVTAEDLKNGSFQLPLPETKLRDSKDNPFIFQDKFISATLVKVSDKAPEYEKLEFGFPPNMNSDNVPEDDIAVPEAKSSFPGFGGHPPMQGEGGIPYSLCWDSFTDLTDRVSVIDGAGWACGVPDQEALDKWYGGEVTLEDVAKNYGPPADPGFEGKVDDQFRRRRMADWQQLWSLDLAGLDIPVTDDSQDIKAGDMLVIACYCRGTGQTKSGGGIWSVMVGETYVANYLIKEGAQAVTNYWNEHILSDSELRELISENGAKVGGSIFEDSIELSSNNCLWAKGFTQLLNDRLDYDVKKYIPLFAGFVADNVADSRRVYEDYLDTIGHLFAENHVKVISDWAKTFNYDYRAQAYSLMGLGTVQAALATDVTEGDNSTSFDALRQLATAVNMKSSEKFLSMESCTFSKMNFSWRALISEVNANASQGVNRVIFHGLPYPVNKGGYKCWWPGWGWGGSGHSGGFMCWDSRNIWWECGHVLTDFIARQQAFLQETQSKVDIAILPSAKKACTLPCNNSHQLLLDAGYTYNLWDNSVFERPELTLGGAQLCPEGPGYRALVVWDVDSLSLDIMNRLIDFAENGVTVVFEGLVPSRVRGMDFGGSKDAEFTGLMNKLKALSNVHFAADEAQLVDILKNAVPPMATASAAGMELSRFTDGVYTYYMVNNPTQADAEAITLELTGDGVPYVLDCWAGRAYPAMEYSAEAGKIRATVTVKAGQNLILALLPMADSAVAPAVAPAGKTQLENWDLTLTCWGPAREGDAEYDPYNPSVSRKVPYSFKNVATDAKWHQLDFDQSMLDELRVPNTTDISGVGVYTTDFEAPDGAKWADLVLTARYKTNIGAVTLNGKSIPVDPMSDVFCLDGAVKPGTNHLEVKLLSSMDNRTNYEDSLYPEPKIAGSAGAMAGMFGQKPQIRYAYGLKTATVEFYK